MRLTENEKKVFMTIIKNKMSIGKIAQGTGLHRQSVKISLQSLIRKKLIREKSDANKILYQAKNLEGIKQNYLSQLEELKKSIPNIWAIYEETKDTQVMNVLHGRMGLRTVLVDEVIKGEDIYSFHLARISEEYKSEYDANSRRRQKLGIMIHVLTPFDEVIPLSMTRKYDKECNINIFGYANKTTIVYDNDKIMTIKIPEICGFFRDMFENVWNQA